MDAEKIKSDLPKVRRSKMIASQMAAAETNPIIKAALDEFGKVADVRMSWLENRLDLLTRVGGLKLASVEGAPFPSKYKRKLARFEQSDDAACGFAACGILARVACKQAKAEIEVDPDAHDGWLSKKGIHVRWDKQDMEPELGKRYFTVVATDAPGHAVIVDEYSEMIDPWREPRNDWAVIGYYEVEYDSAD